MKNIILSTLALLFLGSCISTTKIYYSDPNYLASDEFSSYEDLVKNESVGSEYDTTNVNDTVYSETENFSTDDYYDFSFSSRIKRFHNPLFYSGYYGNFYTDYYWYHDDPFFWGSSIYAGYNWYSPYYSYYSYSPFYHSYYSPYYYGNYFTYGYHFHHCHSNYNTYTDSHYPLNQHDGYIKGNRTNLSTNSIPTNQINNRGLINIKNENSTINIRNNNTKTSSISKNNSQTKNQNRNKVKTNTYNRNKVKTNNTNTKYRNNKSNNSRSNINRSNINRSNINRSNNNRSNNNRSNRNPRR